LVSVAELVGSAAVAQTLRWGEELEAQEELAVLAVLEKQEELVPKEEMRRHLIVQNRAALVSSVRPLPAVSLPWVQPLVL
jgi:hypothetical protein